MRFVLLVAFFLPCLAQAADGPITVRLKGLSYSDFFHDCAVDLALDDQSGLTIGAWRLDYQTVVEGQPQDSCTFYQNLDGTTGTACARYAENSCEAIDAIELAALSCSTKEGAPLACGHLLVADATEPRLRLAGPGHQQPAGALRLGLASKGWSDFFQDCLLSLELQDGAGLPMSEWRVTYAVEIDGLPLEVCEDRGGHALVAFNHSCQPVIANSCERVTGIQVKEVRCLDHQGADIDCKNQVVLDPQVPGLRWME